MAKILITDDEKSVRNVLSEMFIKMGHEVKTAFNGTEALRLFAEKHFDLVTTDLRMPVMDGFILASHIKGKSPETPVILITGDASKVKFEKTKHGHIDCVLLKPFTFQTLEKATNKLLCSDVSRQKKEQSMMIWEELDAMQFPNFPTSKQHQHRP
ncbi:MAG: response regulator [Proteobacteria bacterium]|nr:response regulator [Pseudomonadota bacterium]